MPQVESFVTSVKESGKAFTAKGSLNKALWDLWKDRNTEVSEPAV